MPKRKDNDRGKEGGGKNDEGEDDIMQREEVSAGTLAWADLMSTGTLETFSTFFIFWIDLR